MPESELAARTAQQGRLDGPGRGQPWISRQSEKAARMASVPIETATTPALMKAVQPVTWADTSGGRSDRVWKVHHQLKPAQPASTTAMA